ncbi:MAG: protein-disulfide isomerase [Robiginitomaculum sp.]|nr:MAG: protein-disulfide isomerase [Robiginitomaculum sp.]
MYRIVLMFLAGMLVFGHAYAEAAPKKANAVAREHVELRPFDDNSDAMADVDAALERARSRGVRTVIVMGANWCHDSRALATRLDTPAFKTLISENFELVYVSAGSKPGQNDQNRAVSKRFGVEKIEGTPTVFIATPDGSVLNAESAGYWRRADGVPNDMTYAYFDHYAKK